MTTATNRFRRLMVLLPRFAALETQSLTTLSALLGVSREVILADLHALVERYHDLPGHEEPVSVLIQGDQVTVRTDHFKRPMRVNVAELCALELGLRVLQREAPPERAERIGRIRERLTQCITELPGDAAYAGIRDGALVHPEQGAALEPLRHALRRRRVIELNYHRPGDGDPTPRTVRPYALVFSHGAWYLGAWCERSGGMRMFRTDRIEAVALTERDHEIPPDFSPDQLLVDGRPWVSETDPPHLVVRYSAAIARWIAERDGGPLEADGSALRRMPLADREWAVRHVLQYGPDCEVVEPEELRVEVQERVAGILG